MVLCDTSTGSPAAASQPTGEQLVDYLNQSIDWYRHLAVEESSSTDPADLLFVNDDRQMANQILRLSFDFARPAAQQLTAQAAATSPQSAANSRLQNLTQVAAKTDQVVKDTQSEIDQLAQKLQATTPRERPKLEATLDELRSELALAQARSEALHNILQFATSGSAGASGGNVLAQLQELQRSVPDATLTNQTAPAVDGQTKAGAAAAPSTGVAPAQPRREQPAGLLALVSDLFSLTRKVRAIDERTRETNALTQGAQSLRSPLVKQISALIQRGNELAQQADTSEIAGLQQQKRELDVLTAQFKQT